MDRVVRDRRANSLVRACKSSVFGFVVAALAVAGAIGGGCASDNSTVGSGGSTPGTGGGGGVVCDQDCSTIETPICLKSVCNDGTFEGTLGTCVVVPDDGGTCDDGLFCTTEDVCDGGTCKGGLQNDCGMPEVPCNKISCDETTKTCSSAPIADASPCIPTNVCETNGTCNAGTCSGTAKDCSFSPNAECNLVACNPQTGNCDAVPDASKDGLGCNVTGDLCATGKKCNNGQCLGGNEKDCSLFDQDCALGECNPQTGNCFAMPIAPGQTCPAATNDCNIGKCDANGDCNPDPVANGTSCNDHNPCTSADSCTAGVCDGSPVAGCSLYFQADFETCPDGWTFGGDWACGTPTSVGPAAANGGTGVIGTVLGANYSPSQAYATTFAESPTISLVGATAPVARFALWVHTEGSTYDGAHLEISQDGGAFTVLTTSKAYNLTVGSQPAWGGDQHLDGWQIVTANLAPYVGHQVKLRFSFRSDSIIQYPGVYVDDLIVAEPNAIPIDITTSTLSSAVAGQPYIANVSKLGGTASSVWSIVPGGTNTAWLSIDPSTGALSGTPSMGQQGPVSVTIHVQEPSLPSNFDEETFTFDVALGYYLQNFEGACPNGWTLAGDWQCGVPSSVGPAAAFSGTKAMATIIAGNYSNNDAYATTIATSPNIDLSAATTPTLRFMAWLKTETSFDGFNVKVSTDGTTFTQLTSVTPAYPSGTLAGESAWRGTFDTWQPYTADLSAYAGQVIQVRFAFRSDGSVVYPGVYIDDVVVTDP